MTIEAAKQCETRLTSKKFETGDELLAFVDTLSRRADQLFLTRDYHKALGMWEETVVKVRAATHTDQFEYIINSTRNTDFRDPLCAALLSIHQKLAGCQIMLAQLPSHINEIERFATDALINIDMTWRLSQRFRYTPSSTVQATCHMHRGTALMLLKEWKKAEREFMVSRESSPSLAAKKKWEEARKMQKEDELHTNQAMAGCSKV
jgi:hypothetical protein